MQIGLSYGIRILLIPSTMRDGQWCITWRDACLIAIFQDNVGKPVPECYHFGFYWS